MHRALVHTAAWTLATGAAVTLSWFGVHTVLAGTAYDPPRALPLSDAPSAHPGGDGGAPPRASSTHRPKPSGSPSARPGRSAKPAVPPGDSSGTGAGAGGKGTGSGPNPPGGDTSTAASGTVKSFSTAGGRVVLDMGTRSAQLVSATPDAGWQMQVWQQNQWIRVDFTGGTGRTSVFCTWNGHPPLVQTDTHA
ncbi:hypothetical protein ACH4FX_32845 [Streptomyces sp. NPDC018019]|uniref:hypothetical protein n=1 Tax=Streptomyces sp. NPDC018019 TaxID=3365030 RepID=UPI0037B7F792